MFKILLSIGFIGFVFVLLLVSTFTAFVMFVLSISIMPLATVTGRLFLLSTAKPVFSSLVFSITVVSFVIAPTFSLLFPLSLIFWLVTLLLRLYSITALW